MEITFVRHTSVNVPQGICYGISDVPLATTYTKEFDEVIQKIGTTNFDTIFSSPLHRCIQLATEITNGQSIQVDNRLKELNFGDWEMQEWNSIYESVIGKEWFKDYVNTRCPNGESFADLISKATSFLNELRTSTFNQVLIVTHAGVIRAMMCLIEGNSPEDAFNTLHEFGQVVTVNI